MTFILGLIENNLFKCKFCSYVFSFVKHILFVQGSGFNMDDYKRIKEKSCSVIYSCQQNSRSKVIGKYRKYKENSFPIFNLVYLAF